MWLARSISYFFQRSSFVPERLGDELCLFGLEGLADSVLKMDGVNLSLFGNNWQYLLPIIKIIPGKSENFENLWLQQRTLEFLSTFCLFFEYIFTFRFLSFFLCKDFADIIECNFLHFILKHINIWKIWVTQWTNFS